MLQKALKLVERHPIGSGFVAGGIGSGLSILAGALCPAFHAEPLVASLGAALLVWGIGIGFIFAEANR